jgi:hypothetical protein
VKFAEWSRAHGYHIAEPMGDERAGLVIAALSAGGKVIEDDWQPIETAPPRGEPIEFYFPRKPSGQNFLGEMWRIDFAPWGSPRQPTHWRRVSRPAATPSTDPGASK